MTTLLRLAVAFALVFSGAYYLGGFSQSQSITLAVFAVVFYGMFLSTTNQAQRFVPYSVFVQPNLYAIVKDLGVVTDTQDGWAVIRQGIERLRKDPSNIWDSGFSFTYVTPDLIYVKDSNRFASDEIELFADLAPVTVPFFDPKIDTLDRSYSPHLTLKAARDIGGILTLTLPDWFWEQIKTKETFNYISKEDVSKDHMSGTVDVRIARIPVQEFAVHECLQNGIYAKDGNAKAVKARNRARLRYGWKGKSQSDRYGSESGDELSDVAEHKYCTVYHDPI